MSDCICSGTPGQLNTWDYHSDYCPVYMRGKIAELEAEAAEKDRLIQAVVDYRTSYGIRTDGLCGVVDELAEVIKHD